jgi:hypothetical protein
MITIKFYNNGYETFGHSDINVCAQISAMQYIIEGLIFKLDSEARCFDGDDGSGYTALLIDKGMLKPFFEQYKISFTLWCEEQFKAEEYEISETGKNLKWDNVLKEMEKRGLEFD